MLNFEYVFISSPNCPLFIWSEAIVFFCHFYVFRTSFSTIVVSLSCPLHLIATFCFRDFRTNKDSKVKLNKAIIFTMNAFTNVYYYILTFSTSVVRMDQLATSYNSFLLDGETQFILVKSPSPQRLFSSFHIPI